MSFPFQQRITANENDKLVASADRHMLDQLLKVIFCRMLQAGQKRHTVHWPHKKLYVRVTVETGGPVEQLEDDPEFDAILHEALKEDAPAVLVSLLHSKPLMETLLLTVGTEMRAEDYTDIIDELRLRQSTLRRRDDLLRDALVSALKDV